MTTYSENAIALDAAEEAVVDTRVIDVDFGAADSDVNEKTMHGNLVYDMAEEDAESELAPDPEVYEAARRIDEERWFYRFAKRAFDIIFSLTVLILFCWLFAIIAIAIKIDDPKGPVIFKQERVGKNGTRFMMWKFRSMYSDAESRLDELMQLNEKTGPVFKIALDPRITRAGKWLRKLSLASVIIGAPGDGESTKSLSRSANSSLELQLCERRPGLCFANNPHYKPFKFLSIAVFRDARGAFNRVFTHLLSLAFLDPFRGHAEGFCPSFSSILTEVMCNDGGECCCGIA